MKSVAWVFVASPLLVLAFGGGRYSIWETAVMPLVGVLMLLWFRQRPNAPQDVAAVELVRPDDYDGPDAKLDPFYLAWCDCGWSGGDQPDERAARAEAAAHTSNVLPGLNGFFE